MSENFHLLLIGLPASGKTSLAVSLQSEIKAFTYATDLHALQELLELNRRISSMSVSSLSGNKFWPDVAEAARASGLIPDQYRIRLEKDGFTIADPRIWDDALRRSYSTACRKQFLLFEFSRGIDESYNDAYGLLDEQIYPHSFSVIRGCQSQQLQRLAVVHIACSPMTAHERNRKRRGHGHAVSSRAMATIYSKDVFRFKVNGTFEGALIGATNDEHAWPVLSMDSEALNPGEMHRISKRCIGALGCNI